MVKIYNKEDFILLDFENDPYCQKYFATEFPKSHLVINKLDYLGTTIQLVCGDVNVKLSSTKGKGLLVETINHEIILDNEPIFDKLRELRYKY